MQTLPMLSCFNLLKFSKTTSNNFIFFYVLLLIVFIGLRNEVGGDWIQYFHNYNNPPPFSFLNFSMRNDYLYNYLLFLFYNFGMSYNIFNFLLAIFFVLSLCHFCKIFPSFSLALVFSFPIVVMMMGLGFTRQGIAFAFVLIAITSFLKKNKITFVIWALTAILFHKSSIIILFFYPLIDNKINFFEYFIITFLLIVMFVLLRTDFINLYNNYIGSNLYNNAESGAYLSSKGAIFRVGLNCIAATIFLLLINDITENINEKKLFFTISILCFISLIFVFKYSVFIDRLNYYFTPLQIFVYSRLPFFFNNYNTQEFFKITLSIFHVIVLFIWINYSDYSHAWLPYQNILIEWIIK